MEKKNIFKYVRIVLYSMIILWFLLLKYTDINLR